MNKILHIKENYNTTLIVILLQLPSVHLETLQQQRPRTFGSLDCPLCTHSWVRCGVIGPLYSRWVPGRHTVKAATHQHKINIVFPMETLEKNHLLLLRWHNTWRVIIRSISLLKAFSCRLIPVSRQNSSICCTYCSAVPKVKSYMTYMINCWLLLVQGHTILSPSLTKACPV